MRKSVLFLCAACWFSCKKDEGQTPYDPYKDRNSGTMSAILNGEPWRGEIIETEMTNENGRIYIDGNLFKNEVHTQSFHIGSIELVQGKKQAVYSSMEWYLTGVSGRPRGVDTVTASYHLSEDDIGLDGYYVLEEEDNYIQIDEYEPASAKVKGHFQITLFRSPKDVKQGSAAYGMPDTLRFTNGTFDVRIMKYN